MDENREKIIGEITALKSLLRDTDYEITKYAEGLTDCTTQAEIEAYREGFMEQYGDVIENRKAWRAKIRELEETLDTLADEAEVETETENEAETEPESDPVNGEAIESQPEPEPEEDSEDLFEG